ncbi:Response regulator PleD [bioreactor metagenome]|uniref:Response regulator PleD n=1 Tax=bioreactor metagenome TaxID=1076179 RepID=A0A645EUG1_9ZZZZ
MLDIDHFKAFNDLAGHDGGDALLRQLGAYLAKNVRRFDTVCRYGGEEFLIILPKISALNAQHLAEKLRQGVKKLQVQGSSGLTLQCTISLGIALYPQTAADTETLIKAADEALYRAKNNGRDQSIIAL